MCTRAVRLFLRRLNTAKESIALLLRAGGTAAGAGPPAAASMAHLNNLMKQHSPAYSKLNHSALFTSLPPQRPPSFAVDFGGEQPAESAVAEVVINHACRRRHHRPSLRHLAHDRTADARIDERKAHFAQSELTSSSLQ